MHKTSIEWCDFSSNPILCRRKDNGKIGWGCVRVSPGCQNCYAAAWNQRCLPGLDYTRSALDQVEFFLDSNEVSRLSTSKAISGKRVFLEDMSDLFGEWVRDEWLDVLFAVMAQRTDVTFQVLTKRPERMHGYITWERREQAIRNRLYNYGVPLPQLPGGWPLPNVWLGVTAEDQQRADERIPILLRTPAAIRFVSAEPLLGPLNLANWVHADRCKSVGPAPERYRCGLWEDHDGHPHTALIPTKALWFGLASLHHVIVGGESGTRARTCDLDWIRSIIGQCQAAGVSVFVKQLGSCASDPANGIAGRRLKVAEEGAPLVSLRLKDSKGGDLAEWPADLQIRQFPGNGGVR